MPESEPEIESDFKQLFQAEREKNELLKKQLSEMQKTLQTALEGNAELLRQLSQVQEKLDLLIAKKKNRDRSQFGSKSEGRNPRPAPTVSDRRQRNDDELVRDTALADLPVDEITQHLVPDSERICPNCNVETKFVCNKVTHELETILRSLKHIEHQQETRACPKCKQYIRKAHKPELPIPGSYAGPTLLAQIVSDKVEYGLPNFRQEKKFARDSIPIPRSTQCDWFIALSLAVEPLYELIKREILKSRVVQTDETQIKVQDRTPSNMKKIRRSKMIVCRGDTSHKLVAFLYSKSLNFQVNKDFFKGYFGIIQADAASGFDALFEKDELGNGATEAGCNTHARRRIFNAQIMELEIAGKMLDIYERIYKIEKRGKKLSPDARLALRRRFSKPLMRELRHIHSKNKKLFSPSHLLAEAANYSLNHWRALTRFLKNPEIEVDNNASEREIKQFVLSRKNFLFAGSEAGAKALAIHFTLIASAKRNGLNPVEYLADVFAKINQTKLSEIDQFLPDRWKKATSFIT